MTEDYEYIRRNIRKIVRRSHSMDYDADNLQSLEDYRGYRIKFLENRKRFEQPPPQPEKKIFVPDWVKPGCENGLPITYKRRGSGITDIRIDSADGKGSSNKSGGSVRRATSFTTAPRQTQASQLKYHASICTNTELTNNFDRKQFKEKQEASKPATVSPDSIQDDKLENVANGQSSSLHSCNLSKSKKSSDEEDYEFQKRSEKLEALRKRLSRTMSVESTDCKTQRESNDQNGNTDYSGNASGSNQREQKDSTREALNQTDGCTVPECNQSMSVNESSDIAPESKRLETRSSLRVPSRIPTFNMSSTSSNLSRSNSARAYTPVSSKSITIESNISRTKSFISRTFTDSPLSSKIVRPVELKRYDHIIPDSP